ncbi:structural cement protein Gp24 [Pectobacterium versatile]|uniref:structural cement protein Gp24 n=1 Tax=Pectobacterium versatile TaxID=2488639 RepID=UPI003819B80F
MAGNSYLHRMPIGIAGAVTRPRDLTIEPVTLDYQKQFAGYGLAGKYVNDKFVPLESGDAIANVAGILVRPYPITSVADLAYLGVTVNQVGDNLKRGYICVKATAGNAATAKKGAPVYVRVAAGSTASPVGSFLLTPDATATNTPQLPNAEVMGPGEADGRIEISYKI